MASTLDYFVVDRDLSNAVKSCQVREEVFLPKHKVVELKLHAKVDDVLVPRLVRYIKVGVDVPTGPRPSPPDYSGVQGMAVEAADRAGGFTVEGEIKQDIQKRRLTKGMPNG